MVGNQTTFLVYYMFWEDKKNKKNDNNDIKVPYQKFFWM